MRREGFSPSLSLLMSAFSLPIAPASLAAHLHRLTERSATARRGQKTEYGGRKIALPPCDAGPAASLRPSDTRLASAASPARRYSPDPGNTAAKPASRRSTRAPSGETVGTPPSTASAGQNPPRGSRRWICSPAAVDRPTHAVRSSELQTRPMRLQRHPIGALEDFAFLERGDRSSVFRHLSSVLWNPQLRYMASAPLHFRRGTAWLDQ